VTKDMINPYYSQEEKEKWYKRIDAAKSGLFVPPSDKYETIMLPGALGGANFGNTAADPKKGMLYILTQEYPSVYKLNRIKSAKELMSAGDVELAEKIYTNNCRACHGDNMEGRGIAPGLVDAGQRILFDDFKNLLANGRGQMPGNPHIDDQSATALYRYLGGNPNFRMPPGFRRPQNNKLPDGPVVASGGAPVKPDSPVVAPMSDYPPGVEHPPVRYISDYGTAWPDLLGPVWAWVVAYDLNTGTIKWKKPLGEDAESLKRGEKGNGAVNGSQRKGMVVTSTGILFCTGKGGKLYAYDSNDGTLLWETNLSYESNAQPIMYMLNGKQYLVVNASNTFTKDSPNRSREPGALPRAYVAYALPDK
jgi:Glucose dehydrogenase